MRAHTKKESVVITIWYWLCVCMVSANVSSPIFTAYFYSSFIFRNTLKNIAVNYSHNIMPWKREKKHTQNSTSLNWIESNRNPFWLWLSSFFFAIKLIRTYFNIRLVHTNKLPISDSCNNHMHRQRKKNFNDNFFFLLFHLFFFFFIFFTVQILMRHLISLSFYDVNIEIPLSSE